MLLISNTELHAEGCRKDRDSNSLGPKCHLAHHMTAVSTETNLALSFSSTRPNLLPLSVPTGAAATVLNINNQCLKYSTFCTLSTICSFFPPKNWTDIQPCTSQRKLLSPCFTSVKSFKQTTVYELVLAASRLDGLPNIPPNQLNWSSQTLIWVVLCNHQKVILLRQLWAWQTWGCQKATCKSRRPNRVKVVTLAASPQPLLLILTGLLPSSSLKTLDFL